MHTINCVSRVLESIFIKSLTKNIGFILYLIVIQTINYIIEEVDYIDFLPYLSAYYIEIICISIILSLLPSTVSNFIKWLITSAITLITITDSYCYMRIGAPFGPEMVMLMSETNANEAMEFFTSYIFQIETLHIIGIYGSVIFCFIIIFFLKKKIRKIVFIGEMNVKFKISVIMLLCLSSIYAYIENQKEQVLFFRSHIHNWNTTSLLESKASGKFYHQRCTPEFRFYASYYAHKLSAKDIQIIEKRVSETKVDSCTFTSQNIIFIIGESFNRDHASLYGYEKKTTPFLDELKRKKELFVFTNVVSAWNMTSMVFKDMMSTHSIGQPGNWSSGTLFPALFMKAGYHVDFITNEFAHQGDIDMHDYSGGVFLNSQAISPKLFSCRNPKKFFLDEELLTFYDKELTCKDSATNRFTIFHLIGQHMDYKLRCPLKKLTFKRSDYQLRNDLSKKELDVLVAYDNATHYNDSIVKEIIRRFENKDAIVIYMPDHGEEIFTENHMFGRDLSNKITAAIARQEYRIPFTIWCSKEYKRKHPYIIRQIRKAVNKPFMTDDISHVLLYLAGISCKEYDETRNLLSPNFNTKRKRLLKGTSDYDIITCI